MPIRTRQRKHVDRVGRGPAYVLHLYSARCVLKTDQEIDIFPAHSKIQTNHSLQQRLADVMREGNAFISNPMMKVQYCFFLSVLCMYQYMHAASGLFSWSMELLAFASRQLAPEIGDNSVRFIYILFYYQVCIYLVSERSGRRKPPVERSVLIIYMVRVFIFCSCS